MNIDLSGKTVLVTGASRGIGRAIAVAMGASGARVAVHYNRKSEPAEMVVREIGHDAVALQANLADPYACVKLFEQTCDTFGHIDVLVNNAGIARTLPLEAPLEEWIAGWEETLRVNLMASELLTRLAISHFAGRGGGRILYIASRAAFRGDTPDYFAYAESKGGMVALARSVARGCGKQGVRAFVIAPGFTRTDMAQEFIDLYGEEFALKDVSTDRLTEPEDIAPLAVLLASGLADHATGCTIDVNAASYVR